MLFAEACRLRRQIALRNPLLDFDQAPVHQAAPGDLRPHVRPVLRHGGRGRAAGCTCWQTRSARTRRCATCWPTRSSSAAGCKGQKLSGGPTTPPRLCATTAMGNLSGEDDRGRLVPLARPVVRRPARSLFAYVECQGDRQHRAPHRSQPRATGPRAAATTSSRSTSTARGLEQLTDGTWNDFDPCWLPNGRIAFISERRGGYLRCGRVCPTYTLYDMAADGSDITLPELPRDQRVASQRDARRPDRLHALGLRGPPRLHGPPCRGSRRSTAATRGPCTATTPRATRGPTWSWTCRAIPGSHEVRGHGRAAPRPGVRLAGADRSAGARTTTAWRPVQAAHARGRLPREPGRRRGLRHAVAAERGLLPLRLRRRRCSRRRRPGGASRATTASTWSTLRQQGADLPRSGDRLPQPDPAAAAAPDAAGGRRRSRPGALRPRGQPAEATRGAWSTSTTACKPWPRGHEDQGAARAARCCR